jgi:hypothetical protein
MNRTGSIVIAAVATLFALAVVETSSLTTNLAYAQGATEALRPEVAKPLQAAQELMKTRRYSEALAKLAEAESIPNRTTYENYIINRVKASIAAVNGDDQLAIKTFEIAIESGRMPMPEQLTFEQALISLHFKYHNYGKTIEWINRYYRDGGDNSAMRPLLIQSYYYNNEFARAAQELHADIQADEKAGRIPSEDTLQLLKSCAIKQNDKAAFVDSIEKFVTYYPKKEYWTELLDRVQSKPSFSTRNLLDLYRLKRSLGYMSAVSDYLEMSQLALLDGYPAEAKTAIDEGFEAGVLNMTAESGRHKRLRDQIYKSAAEDAQSLNKGEAGNTKGQSSLSSFKTGFAFITNAQYDKGISMMEQALRQGGLKRPEEAKLQLGYAYYLANRRDLAVKTFQSVQGADGTAEIARYWVLFLNRPQT